MIPIRLWSVVVTHEIQPGGLALDAVRDDLRDGAGLAGGRCVSCWP